MQREQLPLKTFMDAQRKIIASQTCHFGSELWTIDANGKPGQMHDRGNDDCEIYW